MGINVNCGTVSQTDITVKTLKTFGCYGNITDGAK